MVATGAMSVNIYYYDNVCYYCRACSLLANFCSFSRGSNSSWKVTDIFPGFSRHWKVLENRFRPGKSGKFKLSEVSVLESTVK